MLPGLLLWISSCGALEVRNRTVEYPRGEMHFQIQEDIVIGQGGLVIIHPGVTLVFEAGVGITVREGGVLIANVSTSPHR